MSRKGRSALAKTTDIAPIFAALGDATRLTLVRKLAGGQPQSIAQLTAGTDLSRQAVTKHLRVLEGTRLVRSMRVGRETLFELDPVPLRAVRDYAEVVEQQWDDALSRLRAYVEK